MIIAINAFKEKIRRKELYIVSTIGIIILLLFATGNGSLTIGGNPVTGYKMLAPILLIVVNALSCILALVMSLSTIPNEYERRTSHLIWIRKVSQARYHGELALANVISGLASEAVLFVAILIFMLNNGKTEELWRLIPAYLIVAINVSAVSLMTSMLSIIIPEFAAGFLAAAVTVMGILHSALYLLKDIIGGFGGRMIKAVLKLVPDLHGIQAQAGNVLCGGSVDIHIILTGLLAVYVFLVMIFILNRKEA